jgi:hypothetical protein
MVETWLTSSMLEEKNEGKKNGRYPQRTVNTFNSTPTFHSHRYLNTKLGMQIEYYVYGI